MVFAASAIVGIEHCGHLIWVANGLALAYLLLAPRWLWPRYLLVVYCGMLAGGLAAGPKSWLVVAALSGCNLLEVTLAAFALRKRSGQLPQFCDQRYLLRFALYAIVGAPVLTSLLSSIGVAVWTHRFPVSSMTNWISTDGLGTAITTPACVALFQNRLKIPENARGRGRFSSRSYRSRSRLSNPGESRCCT